MHTCTHTYIHIYTDTHPCTGRHIGKFGKAKQDWQVSRHLLTVILSIDQTGTFLLCVIMCVLKAKCFISDMLLKVGYNIAWQAVISCWILATRYLLAADRKTLIVRYLLSLTKFPGGRVLILKILCGQRPGCGQSGNGCKADSRRSFLVPYLSRSVKWLSCFLIFILGERFYLPLRG